MGLRYFNEVDEEGNSAWVFESRDVGLHFFTADLAPHYGRDEEAEYRQPSRPANPVDAK